MNVVDSSGWIEFFEEGPQEQVFYDVIKDGGTLLVPTVCLSEVYRVVRRRRGIPDAVASVGFMQRFRVVDLTADIALSAGEIGSTEGLAFADSLILATSRHFGATLWTQDSDFKEIEGVRYISGA